MSCERKDLMRRLAVESPQALESPTWKEHFQSCPDCREARGGLERSLAVFRRLESESLSAMPEAPGWERFNRSLMQRQWEDRVSRRRRRLTVVAVAASLGLVAMGSVMAYQALQTENSYPAQIVRVSPDQREHLLRSLHNILADNAAAAATPEEQASAAVNPQDARENNGLGQKAGRRTVPVSYPRTPSLSPTFVSSMGRTAEENPRQASGPMGFTMFPQQSFTPYYPR